MRRLLGLVIIVLGVLIGKAAMKGLPEHCTPRPHNGDGSLYIQACTRIGTNHDVPLWIGGIAVLIGAVLLLAGGSKS
jgi:hypothetical protein